MPTDYFTQSPDPKKYRLFSNNRDTHLGRVGAEAVSHDSKLDEMTKAFHEQRLKFIKLDVGHLMVEENGHKDYSKHQ